MKSSLFRYVDGEAVNASNILGCNEWPQGAFLGQAALIKRGECAFSLKVSMKFRGKKMNLGIGLERTGSWCHISNSIRQYNV
jgi:hypothetical protein